MVILRPAGSRGGEDCMHFQGELIQFSDELYKIGQEWKMSLSLSGWATEKWNLWGTFGCPISGDKIWDECSGLLEGLRWENFFCSKLWKMKSRKLRWGIWYWDWLSLSCSLAHKENACCGRPWCQHRAQGDMGSCGLPVQFSSWGMISQSCTRGEGWGTKATKARQTKAGPGTLS